MKKDNKEKGFFRQMLSEGKGNEVSSKRVMGVIGLLFTMFCIGWDIAHCGFACISSASENLLQTLLIMCAALLGLNSVTSIFKGKRSNVTAPKDDTKNKEEEDGENVG